MMKRFGLLFICAGLLTGCNGTPEERAAIYQSNAQSTADLLSYFMDSKTGICYARYLGGSGVTAVPCTQKVLQQITISTAGQTALQQTQQNGINPFVWGKQ